MYDLVSSDGGEEIKFVGFFKEMVAGESSFYRESVSIAVDGTTIYSPDDVIGYLDSGYPIIDVMEGTVDIIGGIFRVPGGSSVLSDGEFVWRMDLTSYVRHHKISLPMDFLEIMTKNNFTVPRVTQDDLIEISTTVTKSLGFRSDPGSAPRG
ncbi:hypothetical protein [Streptomyces sp. NPDC005953]|uniref:hypothetical protein n=1 Tax=Streptomyces sp. NPDC005953 TaxID=3156719 RepID=UPI0033D54F86